jgi:diguanylate cyclase (GGDEF)-like protein
MVHEKEIFNKILDKTCLYSNLIFLIFHITYFFIFLVTNSRAMYIINIGSVTFYSLLFILIKYKKHEAFSFLAFLEITAYMVVATILCGYDSGFQLVFIGLCVLVFFASYFSKKAGGIHLIRGLPISILYACIFIFLYFYCKHFDPVYPLNPKLSTFFYITHTVAVFVFVITFMIVLIEYVFRLEIRIMKDSTTDKLTQVANRLALSTYYSDLNDKENYILSIFDIDDFKKLNDTYGHLCGDYVLKEIARIAKESIDSELDFISRWGGEEFVVLIKIDGNIEDIYKKIDIIRQKINDFKFKYENNVLHATITIGIASFDNDKSLDLWISRADEKLYDGKNSGKNKIVY